MQNVKKTKLTILIFFFFAKILNHFSTPYIVKKINYIFAVRKVVEVEVAELKDRMERLEERARTGEDTECLK